MSGPRENLDGQSFISEGCKSSDMLLRRTCLPLLDDLAISSSGSSALRFESGRDMSAKSKRWPAMWLCILPNSLFSDFAEGRLEGVKMQNGQAEKNCEGRALRFASTVICASVN